MLIYLCIIYPIAVFIVGFFLFEKDMVGDEFILIMLFIVPLLIIILIERMIYGIKYLYNQIRIHCFKDNK